MQIKFNMRAFPPNPFEKQTCSSGQEYKILSPLTKGEYAQPDKCVCFEESLSHSKRAGFIAETGGDIFGEVTGNYFDFTFGTLEFL